MALTEGSLLVQRGGVDLVRVHAGSADVASGTPCSARTRFQIASISKHFTAAAVLLLVEAKAVELSDPVTRWLAAKGPRWADVTVHQLLSHTAGIGHWEDYPEISLYDAPENDVVDLITARGPIGQAGRFAYSSPGYVLLARVVQLVSEEPYERFVADRLFAPAGMSDSFVGSPGARPDVAVPQDHDRRVASFELDHVGRGAGDVWSTADDLMRWDTALADGALLTDGLRQAMFTRQVEVTGSSNAYGYGWTLGDLGGRAARYHGGDNHAFRCLHAWWPDDDLRFVALTNNQTTSHEELHDLARHAVTSR